MTVSLVQQVASAFDGWQAIFSDSKVVSTSVTTVHVLALLFGGGLAIAADRTTLRLLNEGPAERSRHLTELRATHRPVLIALTALVVSGIALLTSDIKTFLPSPVFWLKMGFVLLLLTNGVLLERTETALRREDNEATATPSNKHSRLWNRLKVSAILSIALWTGTAIVGVTLANI
jgi:hypothetical protein